MQAHHDGVTTMERLDQNSLYATIKHPRQTCLAGIRTFAAFTAGGRSTKELSCQLIAACSEPSALLNARIAKVVACVIRGIFTTHWFVSDWSS
jgi:hypothetical protein